MSDDQGTSPLGWLLELAVAVTLIGTVVIYGNPTTPRGPTAEPNEIAKLNVPH